jgi:hypothetical protein
LGIPEKYLPEYQQVTTSSSHQEGKHFKKEGNHIYDKPPSAIEISSRKRIRLYLFS